MNLTKKLISQAFIELCDDMPIEKITVTEIIKKTGISKPTFYNHFLDKYDLIAWIFIQDVNQSRSDNEDVYSIDELTKTLKYLDSKRTFYKKALSNNSQNSLSEIIHKHNMNFNSQFIKNYYKIDKLDTDIIYAVTCSHRL